MLMLCLYLCKYIALLVFISTRPLIIVSADHGICEAPEYMQNLGFEVGRLTSETTVTFGRGVEGEVMRGF